ncbi:hypothetical protein CsSME_00006289 [Camellia sinensis var. sinensis]
MPSLSDLLLQPSVSPSPGVNTVAQALARRKQYCGTGPRPGETIPWHGYVTQYRRFLYGTGYS